MKKRFFPTKVISLALLILCGLFVYLAGCKKTGKPSDEPLQENITMNEVQDWGKWYHSTLTGAPELLFAKAQKAFFKNKFYIRVPLAGSEGMIYFHKDSAFHAVFLRQVAANGIISYPFTGSYESIDLDNFRYDRISFVNGKQIKVSRSMPKRTDGSNTGSVSMGTGWLSQFFYCLSHYLFSVPARGDDGGWSMCTVLGGSGQEAEIQQANDDGFGDTGAALLTGLVPPDMGLDPNNPSWSFDPGGSGTGNQDPVSLEDTWYSDLSYPGIEIGYPWRWWEDDIWVAQNFTFDIDGYGMKNLTVAERRFVRNHPFAALSFKSNAATAISETNNRFPNNPTIQNPNPYLNTKADAFRHSLWCALNTISQNADLAKQYGEAHESEDPVLLYQEKDMDIFNNNIGIAAAATNRNLSTIANIIFQMILDGKMEYLNPLDYIQSPAYNPNCQNCRNGFVPGLTHLIPTNQ